MIVCKLQGGLGNCLFQYFAGMSTSIDNNTDILFDLDYFKSKSNNGIVSHFDLNISKFVKNIPEYNKDQKNLKLVSDNFLYKKIIGDNLYMNGYWQSDKYFKHNFHKIINNLESNIDLSKYKDIDFKNTISIHIRRGDYINLKHLYINLSMEYYIYAINYILNINPNIKNIIVFSDDINWCKNNLLTKFENVIFSENMDEYFDITLMSKCKYNIIANSTFSWWGGYLNSNLDKVVISPKNWFTEKMGLNESDIIPTSWIKI